MRPRRAPAIPMTEWTIVTPLGPFTAWISAAGVHTLQFPQWESLRLPAWHTLADATPVELKGVDAPGVDAIALRDYLADYFRGRPLRLPRIDLSGLTDFQQRVALEAMKVQQGCRTSYGELARNVGQPNAARAVGGVMRTNRLVLLMPCHRVLARHGMGGFSGGEGLKEWLLGWEHHFFATGKVSAETGKADGSDKKNMSRIPPQRRIVAFSGSFRTPTSTANEQ